MSKKKPRNHPAKEARKVQRIYESEVREMRRALKGYVETDPDQQKSGAK
jgi:hypothetical protein